MVEQSALYTKSQNGSTERSGGVIIIKSYYMRIEARLLEELQLETVRAIAYLINQILNAQLNQIIPFKKLQLALGLSPLKLNIAHLYIYGYRAYPLKYNLLRTRKLELRAYIRYLVGYQSTNIFRVYIPSEKKVI